MNQNLNMCAIFYERVLELTYFSTGLYYVIIPMVKKIMFYLLKIRLFFIVTYGVITFKI